MTTPRAPAVPAGTGHRRMAMGHVNRLPPGLGPLCEQATTPNGFNRGSKAGPALCTPFSVFNFVYISRNSIKILKYLKNTKKNLENTK
jgi:hypothetical protein